MNRSSAAHSRRRPRRLPKALWPAASLLLAAGGAQAQSANCDKLRQTLATRIEAGGVQGYGLDIVPAKEATPSGAKIIGTCDGGAFKAVYRRFASSAPAATAPAPTEPPAPIKVAAGPPPAPAPAPMPAPPPAAPPPAPKPAPSPPPPAPAPPPVVAPVIIAAAEPATAPAAAPAPAPSPATTEPTLTLASVAQDPARLPSVPSPAAPLAPAAASGTDWRWLWALLALPIVGWMWSWVQHRRHYDAAGLPRGPRL